MSMKRTSSSRISLLALLSLLCLMAGHALKLKDVVDPDAIDEIINDVDK